MLKVAVIADDLTGAADTGVLFVPVVKEMRLLSAAQFSNPKNRGNFSGVTICTDSRSMNRWEAGLVVADLAGRLKAMRPDLIYKKIDSCLRGHVGIELLRLLDSCGRRGALVAPAYPRLGRTTVNNIHYVLGVPVAESEAGRDPVRPVKSSLLSENLALGHDEPVGAIGLNVLEKGEEILIQEIGHELKKGRRLIAVDAATEEHLALIAKTALKFFPDLVLSGSGGLARAVIDNLPYPAEGAAACPPAPEFRLSGLPALFVGGSASTILREQLENLAKDQQVFISVLNARKVLWGLSDNEKYDLSVRLDDSDLILCLSPTEKGEDLLPSQALSMALGLLVAGLVRGRSQKLSAIFASGGDTAQAVLTMLGSPEVVLKCELAPGFIVSTLSNGPCAGLFFLTKSGSFGEPDMLSEIYKRLRRKMP